MDSILMLKGKIQTIYSGHTKVIDKGLQFALAFITFYTISHQIGFMKLAASGVALLALTVLFTALPVTLMPPGAAAVILAHMYGVSLSALIVTALVFVIIYAFFMRFSPKLSIVLLITPLAFALKIPYVIPVACGLLLPPVALVPVVGGIAVYYMMNYVKKAAAGMKGSDAASLTEQMSAYIKQVFQNKEMWVVAAAFIVSLMLVYMIRRQAISHSWKIAVAVGAIANVAVVAGGGISLGVKTNFGSLIGGNVLALLIGLVLELFFFSVDYMRGERLQFEDDEYYYYVKAIPKLAVPMTEKRIKRINERNETEIIDTEAVKNRHNESKKYRSDEEVEKLLLKKSLNNDPDLK